MMNDLERIDLVFTDATEIREHLDRVLASERFRKMPSLTHLLEYLVTKTLQGEQGRIKEATVALAVFSRSSDFDSRIDNIVRVHAHRLRKVLKVYYEGEGAAEKIRITIPTGGYIAQVHLAAIAGPAGHRVGEPIVADSQKSFGPNTSAGRIAVIRQLPAFLLGASAVLFVLLLSGRISPAFHFPLQTGENLRAEPLSAIWRSILQPGVKCVVSFTNPVFLWTDTAHSRLYMTYRGPVSVPLGAKIELAPSDPFIDGDIARKSGPFFFSDSWTGTGEVAAVQKLTRLFSEAEFPLKIVRSRLLSYSDMKSSNLIFLGSPWANDMQDRFNIRATPLMCRNNEVILNLKPKAGEPSSFHSIWTPNSGELIASYGLFSVLHGITPGMKIVISAGLNTYATSDVVDYVTSPAGVRELMRRFGTLKEQILPDYFQAVIRTEIIKGEAAGSTLVLVRSLPVSN